MQEKLESFQKANKDPIKYYELVKTWLKNSEQQEVDGVPRSFIVELARHPVFTSLQKQLNKQHYLYSVVNASVSGETTSGGLSRFANTLAKTKPSIVIVELGANDGLRGLPIQEMSNNLNKMLELSKKADAKVLLLGMRIPPNYGLEYTKTFTETYTQLSKKHNATLVPFMLENIAAKPQLIQDDGLHPNALGQAIILENVWPYLSKLLNAKCLAKAN